MRVTKVTEVTNLKSIPSFFCKIKLKLKRLENFRSVTYCCYVSTKTYVTTYNTKVTLRKLKLKKQLFSKKKDKKGLTFVTFVTMLGRWLNET